MERRHGGHPDADWLASERRPVEVVDEAHDALCDRLDVALCEPVARNTAPCIAYACYKIAEHDPQANVVVAPADHIILKEDAFKQTIRTALNATQDQEILVTLGIQPSRPDTGYGYIQYLDDTANRLPETGLFRVKTFTEKPNLELAKMFLASGDFLWNAGLFIWRADVIVDAFHQYLSERCLDILQHAVSV